MKRLLAAIALLAIHGVAFAQARVTVMATGDSYTRRTICSAGQTYDQCDQAYGMKHDVSYATYLNAVTAYQIWPVTNSARGGETCITPPPSSPNYYMSPGPWSTEVRGLMAQAATRINNRTSDVASILLGINDINMLGESSANLKSCLQQLYQAVAVTGGKKVLAMTYPPVSPTTGVWGAGYGPTASANVAVVNTAIRDAVTAHNAAYPANKVDLLDTSTAWVPADVGTYTSDGAHPNQKGAWELARKWYQLACGISYMACTAGY